MKVHGPATASSNNIEEGEEEIHDCIGIAIAHPGFPRASLPEFIDSVDEMVENSAEQEEQFILNTYDYESHSDGGDIQDVAVISYQAALEDLERIRQFRLQNPRQFTARRTDGGSFVSRKAGY